VSRAIYSEQLLKLHSDGNLSDGPILFQKPMFGMFSFIRQFLVFCFYFRRRKRLA